MMFDVSPEELKLFLEETDENLHTLEEGIMELEKSPDAETLNRVFRAAHTIKGSSATLGHQRMSSLTHAMENLLDRLRKGTLTVSAELIDTLLACLDALRAFRDEIASGEASDVRDQELFERMRRFENTGTAAGNQADAGEWPDGPLSELERAQISGARAEGLLALDVRVQIDPHCVMPSVRAFQLLLALADVGQVVCSWPSQAEIEAEQVQDRVRVLMLMPDANPEPIRQAVEAITDLKLAACIPYNETGSASSAHAQETPSQADVRSEAQDSGKPQSPAPERRQSGRSGRTVRVDVEVLDELMNLVGELVMDRTRLMQAITQADDRLAETLTGIAAHLGRTTSNLQDVIQKARMQPIAIQFKKFPRVVRDAAQKAGKEVNLIIRGEETELDRSVIEEIGDPIMHILRNAVDHGLEPPEERERIGKPRTGTVILEAAHEDGAIIISIRDDGRGIDLEKVRASAVKKGLITAEEAERLSDEEAISLIWKPGFSTADKVSEVSGRGVGLDVVHRSIERLGGTVTVLTERGKGTEFRIRLPLTLLIMRALHVQVGDRHFCIPLSDVAEVDCIHRDAVQRAHSRSVLARRGEITPLIWLRDFFHIPAESGPDAESFYTVFASRGGRRVGLVVDRLLGEGEVVIKPLGSYIGEVPGLCGATLLGDGGVALILDVGALLHQLSMRYSSKECEDS